MARTIADMIEGLKIFAQFFPEGEQTSYFCGGEHDIIYFYVTNDVCAEDSAEGIKLIDLGFHYDDDVDSWAYHT